MILIDVAKGATDTAHFITKFTDKPIADVVSMRLVGIWIIGVNNDVTANRPDYPCYLLRIHNLRSSTYMSGTEKSEYPIMLKSAPFMCEMITNEAMQPVFELAQPMPVRELEFDLRVPDTPLLINNVTNPRASASTTPSFTQLSLLFVAEQRPSLPGIVRHIPDTAQKIYNELSKPGDNELTREDVRAKIKAARAHEKAGR